jgi:hypothetical protein
MSVIWLNPAAIGIDPQYIETADVSREILGPPRRRRPDNGGQPTCKKGGAKPRTAAPPRGAAYRLAAKRLAI